MYYRKYFAGTIENATVTKLIKKISNDSNISVYPSQSHVLCSAIQSTLNDVGITCTYEQEDYRLTINGVTVQLCHIKNGTAYNIVLQCHGQDIGSFNGSQFNNMDYRFYITLKGDIEGLLKISIGIYTNPNVESYGIVLGKGIDLEDGTEIRVACGIYVSGTGNAFYILKDNKIFEDYKDTIIFGFSISNKAELGTGVTLVEAVAQLGRFKLNNCYFGHSALATDYFYNIGGDIYFSAANTLLVKCTKE